MKAPREPQEERPLLDAVNRWAREHDAGLVVAFCHDHQLWDCALRIKGTRVTVKIPGNESEARVRVPGGLSRESTARTGRGLIKVLSEIEKRIDR